VIWVASREFAMAASLATSFAIAVVTEGLHSALRQAQQAAGDRNVLIMGGPTTGQQFIRAGLVDEIHMQLVPVFLGTGTRLFDHLGTDQIELERTAVIESPHVTHLRFQLVR
jgi:dihydrofolate reductase